MNKRTIRYALISFRTILTALFLCSILPLRAALGASYKIPSTYELACLSTHVYKEDLKPGSKVMCKDEEQIYKLDEWQVQEYFRKKKGITGILGGYRGALFYNTTKSQVVLAHRGTTLNLDSIICDLLSIALGWTEGQAADSQKYLEKSLKFAADKNATFYITGHSLGGWLAQDSVLRLQTHLGQNSHLQKIEKKSPIHCVTFDTPGAGLIFANYRRKNPKISSFNITNYLSAPNVVNTCQPHIGRCYRLVFDFEDNKNLNLYSHKLSNFHERLKNSSGFRAHHIQCWPHVSLEEEIDKIIDSWNTKGLGNFVERFKKIIQGGLGPFYKHFEELRANTQLFSNTECEVTERILYKIKKATEEIQDPHQTPAQKDDLIKAQASISYDLRWKLARKAFSKAVDCAKKKGWKNVSTIFDCVKGLMSNQQKGLPIVGEDVDSSFKGVYGLVKRTLITTKNNVNEESSIKRQAKNMLSIMKQRNQIIPISSAIHKKQGNALSEVFGSACNSSILCGASNFFVAPALLNLAASGCEVFAEYERKKNEEARHQNIIKEQRQLFKNQAKIAELNHQYNKEEEDQRQGYRIYISKLENKAKLELVERQAQLQQATYRKFFKHEEKLLQKKNEHDRDMVDLRLKSDKELDDHKKGKSVFKQNLPGHHNIFIERKELLNKLKDAFFSKGSKEANRPGNKCVILNGWIGSGKTTLAWHYGDLYWGYGDYPKVWWIDGTNKETIEDSIRSINKSLKKEVEGKSIEELQKNVFDENNIKSKGIPFLIIWDNIFDWKLFESYNNPGKLYPNTGGHILITTRDNTTQKRAATTISVKEYTDEQTLSHFRKCLQGEEEEKSDYEESNLDGSHSLENEQNALSEIIEKTGKLPIMIDRVATYISNKEMSYQEYLKEMKSDSLGLQEKLEEHAKTLYKEIKNILEGIKKKEEKDTDLMLKLINLITYCDGTSLDDFLCKFKWIEEKVDGGRIIRCLKERGLLKGGRGSQKRNKGSYKIHFCYQNALHYYHKRNGRYSDHLLETSKIFYTLWGSVKQREELLRHMLSFWQYVRVHLTQIEPKNKSQEEKTNEQTTNMRVTNLDKSRQEIIKGWLPIIAEVVVMLFKKNETRNEAILLLTQAINVARNLDKVKREVSPQLEHLYHLLGDIWSKKEVYILAFYAYKEALDYNKKNKGKSIYEKQILLYDKLAQVALSAQYQCNDKETQELLIDDAAHYYGKCFTLQKEVKAEQTFSEPRIYYELGRHYRAVESLDKALKKYSKAIKRYKVLEEVLEEDTPFLLSQIYFAQASIEEVKEETDSSKESYKKAIAASSNISEITINANERLANIFLERKEPEKELQHLQEAWQHAAECWGSESDPTQKIWGRLKNRLKYLVNQNDKNDLYNKLLKKSQDANWRAATTFLLKHHHPFLKDAVKIENTEFNVMLHTLKEEKSSPPQSGIGMVGFFKKVFIESNTWTKMEAKSMKCNDDGKIVSDKNISIEKFPDHVKNKLIYKKNCLPNEPQKDKIVVSKENFYVSVFPHRISLSFKAKNTHARYFLTKYRSNNLFHLIINFLNSNNNLIHTMQTPTFSIEDSNLSTFSYEDKQPDKNFGEKEIDRIEVSVEIDKTNWGFKEN